MTASRAEMTKGNVAPTVQAVRDRQDWYALAREHWDAHLKGVPGCVLTGRKVPKGKVLIHRTHLPLLPNYESQLLGGLDYEETGELESRLDFKPRETQLHDRVFCRSRRGALLAHAMRKGKSGSAVLSHELPEGQLVIVAPLAAREVWKEWIARRWSGRVEPFVVEGTKFDPKVLRAPQILLMHYEILDAWRSMGVLHPATVVFDEAHAELTNKKAKRTKAARVLAAQASARVLVLSGTPLWNKPAGLFSMLQLLAPGAFGTYFQFAKRYCGGHAGPFGFSANGSSNEEELQARMKELMRCEEWSAEEKGRIKRSVEVVSLEVSQLLELDKAAMAEGVPSTTIGSWAQYRKLLGMLKVGKTIELAMRHLRRCEPVVIWTWHRDVALQVYEGISALMEDAPWRLSSDLTSEDRHCALVSWRQFNNSALIASIGVGQTAIDLSHAKHAIFCEQSWTPSEIAQAEMRTFKPGRDMDVTYVVTDHAIDLRVAKSLAEKVKVGKTIGVPAAEGAVDVIADALSVEVGDEDILESLRMLFNDQSSWMDE